MMRISGALIMRISGALIKYISGALVIRIVVSVLTTLWLLQQPALAAGPDWKDYGALQKIHDLGYEITFLGNQDNYQGWLAQKPLPDGQMDARTFYTRAGQQIVLSGLLFNNNGDNLTGQQLQTALQNGTIKTVQSAPASAVAPPAVTATNNHGAQLYNELGAAHTIDFGNNPKLPTLYAFVDPNCPYCKKFWQAVDIAQGAGLKFNVKLIAVGILGDNSEALAAAILAAPDSAAAWRANAAGRPPTLISNAPAQKMVSDNENIMLRWGMTSVPFIVYRTPTHDVKIVRGNPTDVTGLLVDLGVGSK